MNPELRLKLDAFEPRDYQIPVLRAFDEGIKRVLLVMHRRWGKDILAINIVLREALKRVGAYYYLFPEHTQVRKAIWDGKTIDGRSFLSFFPEELIIKKRIQDMVLELANGSLIQFIGSDRYDSLRGTNPVGVVFSEYAYQHPQVLPTLSPILNVNNGWMLFISTPFGENHFYTLYQAALHDPKWFVSLQTIDDTGIVTPDIVEQEIRNGIMSPDMAQQEYYCSFSVGAIGSYYATYLNRLALEGHVTEVPWDAGIPVHTAWDLGMSDETVIIFFQLIGQAIKIIDLYANKDVGLEHYINVVLSKPYTYGKHIAPHDIRVRDYTGGGLSRWDKANKLGITFNLAPDMTIIDGIETVRSTFPRLWIDQTKCAKLISAIRDYRKEYDTKRKVYNNKPLHDANSHYCFTAETLILTRIGIRPIISIQDNDEVMTLKGWKKCTKAHKTKINANLVEVIFQDGMKVKCTPDHLFLTDAGWKSAESLTKNFKIQSSLMRQHKSLMEKSLNFIPMINILNDLLCTFIEKCGQRPLVQFLKDITSIIKTEIHPIIISGTLNVFQCQSILQYQNQMPKEFQRKREELRQNGMDLPREEDGIVSILKELEIGKNGQGNRYRVNFVEKFLTLWLEWGQQLENFVIPTVKPLLVESVLEMKETADVYDIGVPEVGHFSLANGAVVHNCDALRYLCTSLPQLSRGTTPEQLESRYAEAMRGDRNLPKVFEDPHYY